MLIDILLLSFLGSFCGLLGGIILLIRGKVSKETSLYLISFAAGVMLSATFLDLLPEAVSLGGENVFLLSLIGLVTFFMIENFILHFHHHEGHKHSLTGAVPLIIFSDSVHNFIDGIVIASAFMADPKLGLVVALATFVHEVPQEIGDFAVLLSTGMKKIKVLGANLLSAAATLAGAVGAYYSLSSFSGLRGTLLGLATGMFLYISSADILPTLVREQDKNNKWGTATAFIWGIVLIYVLTLVLPD